jgi:DNA-binding response OmpR family regulator
MYTKKFTDEGHEVRAFPSVKDTLQALEEGFEPDAIVFDLVMPEEDGFDLLQSIKDKKLAPGAALIALTNQGADEEREKTEKLGAHEYIVKAASIPSEVFNIITDVIKRVRKA